MSAADRAARSAPARAMRGALHGAVEKAEANVGGTARLRVITLFAGVLMLQNADTSTVGALAAQLERSLHISNTQIGLIAAISSLAGAFGTVPVGVLTDRVNRVRLLSASIVLWSAAMLASAFAPSFAVLVLTRMALGAVAATAGPTLASLIGDLFPASERAKVWGMVLTGELLGAGIGVVGSGGLAGALSWRYGFGWLAIPGLVLAFLIAKLLVEPARGGQSRLEPGAEEIVGAAEAQAQAERASEERPQEELEQEQELAQDIIRRQGHRPDERLVLHRDPVGMSLKAAIKYILRVRTNVVIIVASSLAYIFFAGVQTFAVELMRSRYRLSQGTASLMLLLVGLGAIAGVVLMGRLADRMLRRGRPNARVAAGAFGYVAAAALFAPGLLSPWLVVSMPLFVLGGAALAAPDSPLNAARLDIMHPRLWGRAEGVRTFLQMLAFAVAPLLFGGVSQLLGGSAASGGTNATTLANGNALAHTFLIMLVPLAVGGLILLRARRTYPGDVATAIASIDATSESVRADTTDAADREQRSTEGRRTT